MLQNLTLTTLICTFAVANPPQDIPADWWYPGLQRSGASGKTTDGDETLSVHYTYETEDPFQQTAIWYAEKAGVKNFRERLVSYLHRSPENAEEAVGTLTHVNIDEDTRSTTTLIFSLKPRHKHVTIIAPQPDSGEMIVVSMSESTEGTIVQFARRQVDSKTKLAQTLSR